MVRFQFIRNMISAIREALSGESGDGGKWQVVSLRQVETASGFVPLEDMPFTAATLQNSASRNLESNRSRLLRLGGANLPLERVAATASREPFTETEKGSPQESPYTHCPVCIEQGLQSRTFVGPVFSLCLAVQKIEEGVRYHGHDPNAYRLTYLCSNGHRWERVRWKRCWCRWTAAPKRKERGNV